MIKKLKLHHRIGSQSKNSRNNAVNKDAVISAPYDLVILDYKMPGMNGMDVAKEILAVNPRQRIIFASAYVEETHLSQVTSIIKKWLAIIILFCLLVLFLIHRPQILVPEISLLAETISNVTNVLE